MSRPTSNWVDRGDAVEEPLCRILASAFNVLQNDERLVEIVLVIRGQVEASATEGDVAKYVETLLPVFARPALDTLTLRLLGTALWHIAKVGTMREHARSAH